MKTRLIPLFAALIALSACGSSAQFASTGQQFQDGIYYRPEPVTTLTVPANDEELTSLIEQTKGSEIYLRNGQGADTLFIPENMSATVRFDRSANTTTVTLSEAPVVDIWMGYSPYSRWYYRSSWAWGSPFYRPWRYSAWAWDPWYWDFYDPWYYGSYWGWHSPYWYDAYWYGGYYGGYYGYYGYHYPYGHGNPFAGTGLHGNRYFNTSNLTHGLRTDALGGRASRSSSASNRTSSGNIATRSSASATSRTAATRPSNAATRSSAHGSAARTSAARSSASSVTRSSASSSTVTRFFRISRWRILPFSMSMLGLPHTRERKRTLFPMAPETRISTHSSVTTGTRP